MSRSWSTVWINMQKMSNGDYFDEKMRRGDRSKEARRISPPLKLLLKSPKLRGSTAPKSAHLHRGREQGVVFPNLCLQFWHSETSCIKSSVCLCPCRITWPLNFLGSGVHGGYGAYPGLPLCRAWRSCLVRWSTYLGSPSLGSSKGVNNCVIVSIRLLASLPFCQT